MSEQAKLVVLDDEGNVFDAVTFEVADGTNVHEVSTKYAVRTTRVVDIRVEFKDATSKINAAPHDGDGDFWTSPVANLPVTLGLGGALVLAPRSLKLDIGE